MKRSGWRWLAVSSALLIASAAIAETRPQYGGTVHVMMRAAPVSLDPADRNVADSPGRRAVTSLLFDTLVTLDAGNVIPSLADAWQSPRANQRWQFRLRQGVKFSDGTLLSPEVVAASLRFANPSWTVRADGDSVVIEADPQHSNVLVELALPRNSIVKRESNGKVTGTGAFRVSDWQAGHLLTLAAEETCWRGRPFLDTIEIEMDKSFRDQFTALQSGKTDLIEIAPEQQRRMSLDSRRSASSASVELLALLFATDATTQEEKVQRTSLAWSLDRASIRDVLLQGTGQPAGGILPTWMSGYGFVFPTGADLAKARQLRGQARSAATWKLSYDATTPLDRVVAERIALNAKDAGLLLQPTSSAGDLRLAHIAIASGDPWTALQNFFDVAGLTTPRTGGSSVEDVYAMEQAAISSGRVIPLFHLPVAYASATNLRNWNVRMDGSWDLSGAWLENEHP
jgi:ABC-type transport system substrate-binding protein